MKKIQKSLKSVFVTTVFIGLGLYLQSCSDDGEAAKAQPDFVMATTAQVQVLESVEIDITNITTPGGFKAITAQVIAGTGNAVVVANNFAAGATGPGTAVLTYTADATAGAATVEVRVSDEQNPSLSTSKSVQITKTETPPPTVEEITGIADLESDDFSLSFSTKNGADVIEVLGTINRSITIKDISADGYDWLFTGSMFVVTPSGGSTTVLTVEPGAKMYFNAESGQTSYLAVQRDAQINAVGTKDKPILMTTSSELGTPATPPAGGQWGGLVLNGNANINVGDEAEGEGGSGAYGGSDDSDDSGDLAYIVLKYPGRLIGTDNELNGFSFNGCGSGTTGMYIQSWLGEDDGFEWFGGTATIKYAISSASKDDSFDWTHGWRGQGQFLVVQQADQRGDRGFECDNLEADFTAEPYSQPTLSNLTILGGADASGSNIGMRLRHGTKGLIHNALVTNWQDTGVRADDDATTAANVTDESLILTHSVVWSNAANWAKSATGWEDANGNTSTDPMITFTDGVVGTTATGAVDPTTVYGSDFFESVSFIGAVPADDNWLAGWALKLDGTFY